MRSHPGAIVAQRRGEIQVDMDRGVPVITHNPELHGIPPAVTLGVLTDHPDDAIDKLERSYHTRFAFAAAMRRLVTRRDRRKDESRVLLAYSSHKRLGEFFLQRQPAIDITSDVRVDGARRVYETAIQLAASRQPARDHRLHA